MAAHLVVVSVVGGTSGFRFHSASAAQTPRMVRVELVRDPMEQPRPRPAPAPIPKPDPTVERPRPPEPATVAVPHPQRPNAKPAGTTATRPQPTAGSSRPAGDPGGRLNTGSTSSQGDLPGNWSGGKTPRGWVPGQDSGAGAGSGSGKGTGTPDPPLHADPGPGTRPAPSPTPPPAPPPPPPAPKMVNVRVCSDSGMLPGPHCKHTENRSFVEGKQPTRICSKCKAPEPVHKSTLADRENPLLVKDTKVNTGSLEEGMDVSVQVEYTVTADGDVTGVRVTKSSGNRAVDRAVADAASGLKYKPAVQNGVPRSVKMTRTYRIRT